MRRRGLLLCLLVTLASAAAHAADPLPSWNDGPAKRGILAFVTAATADSSPQRIAPEDRIATFDQDGTLWVEHPFYAQAMFALDQVRALALQHPEWKKTEPFATVLGGDAKALAGLSESDWHKIVGVTHAGMDTETFTATVKDWLTRARHPRFDRPYTELAYQPMLELLTYLQSSGFKTYIVTGGGQEFVRAYSQSLYGVPPEQVIGSSMTVAYERRAGKPALMREPKVFFVDDHAGKPIGINLFIGKRPVAAFGNSDGDAEMLEWTQAGGGLRLELVVHHDDPAREYAYGPAGGMPDTKVGTFSTALLDQAKQNGWLVISVKRDWNHVFKFDEAGKGKRAATGPARPEHRP
jgi:phosphoglycolate phosphatase-like HAD superfamily hydrolase